MNEKPEEIRAKARELLHQGISPTEIARRLPIGRATLYRWKAGWDAERQLESVAKAVSPEREPVGAAREPGDTSPETRTEPLDEEEALRQKVQEPAGGVPQRIYFRGPRDREQYLACLAEADGDFDRVARRGPDGASAPWITLPPPLRLPEETSAAVWNRIFFGKSRRLNPHGALDKEHARARRIRKALTPEYIREYQKWEQKAREAVGYDVEPPPTESGARPV